MSHSCNNKSSSDRPRAVVIGAGIAGIASAIRLATKGYEVDVFESNPYAGGKISEFAIGAFRFDAGPSLFTMPHYVDELFAIAGKDPRDYFKYQRVDPVCSYFFEDGTVLKAWGDKNRLAEELADKTKDTKEAINAFLANSERIYSLTHHVFLEKSLHRLRTYFSVKTLKSLLRLNAIDAFRTMNEANQSYFRDSKTIHFFNRYATYNGSDPYRAPATLNIIPHLEQFYGAWFPEGGMYAITSSLVKLAEDTGVRFHFNSPVSEIVVSSGRLKGVITGGKTVPARIVISNSDVWFTYKKLLKGKITPARSLKQERSSSALIFYWGIKASFSELDLHNIFFSENYTEEFAAIWGKKTISDDPTIYINISSKYKIDDAPPRCENWFVMINVPPDYGQDWESLIARAKANVINKVNRVLKTDIRRFIIAESVLDPRSIEAKTASYRGALYGNSSNNRFSAFLRHPNFSRRIKGLYFAGGSVHPGGGIPLALLSAKIAVNDIK